MDARWRDSLQCAMALAMPSCCSMSESSRRDGGDRAASDICAADAERLFRRRRSTAAAAPGAATRRSRLEIKLRYRRMTSPEGGLILASPSWSWSGEPYPPYAAKSLVERALLELREKLARPP
uniref:Uncharacterized protein n=1 Tax=Arundo donax TaxID=35708 RepID=A0A0A9CBU6_ARUDO